MQLPWYNNTRVLYEKRKCKKFDRSDKISNQANTCIQQLEL